MLESMEDNRNIKNIHVCSIGCTNVLLVTDIPRIKVEGANM